MLFILSYGIIPDIARLTDLPNDLLSLQKLIRTRKVKLKNSFIKILKNTISSLYANIYRFGCIIKEMRGGGRGRGIFGERGSWSVKPVEREIAQPCYL